MLDRALVRQLYHRSLTEIQKQVRIFSNRREYDARRQEAVAFADPTAEWQKPAHDLREDGYTFLPGIEQPHVEAAVMACRQVISAREATAERMKKKFFMQLLDDAALEAYPDILRLALDEKALATVAVACGRIPYLQNVHLLASLPGTDILEGSQNWHVDRNDSMVIKQFLYINDVGDEEGPLGFISLKDSANVRGIVPHYLTDQDMARYVDPAKTIRVKGPAGTRTLVDTGKCFHYGSRVRKTRYALIVYYNSGFAREPRERDWGQTFVRDWQWSPLQRRVLGLA